MAQAEALYATLTERQRETLKAIGDLQAERGYAPSVREIQERTSSSSPSNIHDRLVILRDLGLVTWVEGQSRTLVLTNEGRMAL